MSKTALQSLGFIGQGSYAWVITKDLIQDGASVGTIGPSTCPDELSDKRGKPIVRHEKSQKFRISDDDNEVYFYGYFVDLSSPDDDTDVSAFEPLEDYGEAFGCVHIEYRNKETGEYEYL